MMKTIPVIMAGGAGTRLWPMSRDDKPKQFHNLSGEGSLLAETVRRLQPLNPEHTVVVTSERHGSITEDELKKNAIEGSVLCEPQPKNTAAAVLYAAVYINSFKDDAVMVVLPADHYIRNRELYAGALKTAVAEAERGGLVTIGLKPAYPDTGFGYIKAKEGSSGSVLPVERFVEKPDIVKAREYVASGSYFWNSGIFVWKVSTILKHFEELMPGHMDRFRGLMELRREEIKAVSGPSAELKKEIFSSIESISIDYGILEKAADRSLVPADFGWTDLGSWPSIDSILEGDSGGNRSPEPGKALFVDSSDCSVFSESSRITVLGLENVTVVEAGGEILVMSKDRAQDVRKVVDMIRSIDSERRNG